MAQPTTVSADQSKNLPLKFRKGEGRPITFQFLQDSAAFDISVYAFVLQIIGMDGTLVAEFTEDSGGGLTNGGVAGTLVFDPSDDDVNIDAKAYRWKLKILEPKQTIFNALFTINDDPQEEVGADNLTVELDLGDLVVNIEVNLGEFDPTNITEAQAYEIWQTYYSKFSLGQTPPL